MPSHNGYPLASQWRLPPIRKIRSKSYPALSTVGVEYLGLIDKQTLLIYLFILMPPKNGDAGSTKRPSAKLRLLQYDIEHFAELVAACGATKPFKAALYQDAYSALNRARERFMQTKQALHPEELKVLEHVFEDNEHIKRLLSIRQIADHVHHRTGATVPIYTTRPVKLPIETSAGSMFAGPVFVYKDAESQAVIYLNHLDQLSKGVEYLRHALKRALIA